MNNERFKFRAWSKKESQFVNDFILDRLGNWYQTDKCEFWGDERDLIVTQCTGFKDRNGKLIFEGDFLRIEDARPYGIQYQFNMETGEPMKEKLPYSWIVEWKRNGWGDLHFLKNPYINVPYDETEIFGNKFENSDLLK